MQMLHSLILPFHLREVNRIFFSTIHTRCDRPLALFLRMDRHKGIDRHHPNQISIINSLALKNSHKLAFMDGCANRVEVEKCSITGNNVRHAHVLPTPYNLWEPAAPSISLPEDFCWYGSEGVIDQWIDYI